MSPTPPPPAKFPAVEIQTSPVVSGKVQVLLLAVKSAVVSVPVKLAVVTDVCGFNAIKSVFAVVEENTAEPAALRIVDKLMSVSPPVNVHVGLPPAAAFASVNSLIAEVVVVN